MKEEFDQNINGRDFHFKRVFINDIELKYHITFDYDGTPTIFRMYKEEESGMWKIHAQVLPIEIHELDMDLSDAITENELL